MSKFFTGYRKKAKEVSSFKTEMESSLLFTFHRTDGSSLSYRAPFLMEKKKKGRVEMGHKAESRGWDEEEEKRRN